MQHCTSKFGNCLRYIINYTVISISIGYKDKNSETEKCAVYVLKTTNNLKKLIYI